jgi:hypothetical protein
MLMKIIKKDVVTTGYHVELGYVIRMTAAGF